MTQRIVETYAVETPLRAWLHVGTVPGPSRMGVTPSHKRATHAVTLRPGDEVHLAGGETYAVRHGGAWRAEFRPPCASADLRYSRRPRETLAAFRQAGILSGPGTARVDIDHAALAAAHEAVVHPSGTPVDLVVDVSPALVLASALARDVAERLADAGVVARLGGREATPDAPARAVVSTPMGDVTVVANAFGYVMARLSTRLPCLAGKVEGRDRVVRFGSGPASVGEARDFLSGLAGDLADACGHAPGRGP